MDEKHASSDVSSGSNTIEHARTHDNDASNGNGTQGTAYTNEKAALPAERMQTDTALTKEKEKGETEHVDELNVLEAARKNRDLLISNVNARLANPLAGYTPEQLQVMGRRYAREHGMEDKEDIFAKGAVVAGDPGGFENIPTLTEEDKVNLRLERTHKWKNPGTLYWLVICCSLAAAVQGMDESVISGANLFFPQQFGIATSTDVDPTLTAAQISQNELLLGLVNGAPYLCCAILGCWLTTPLNDWFGRRGAIFITAMISFLTCIWSGVTNSWPHLFAARFVLGIGIGAKSATVPVYAAECSPPAIRGALVMMWQTWTAFGIMIGYVADLVFYNVKDTAHVTGLNWRLMLGSAGFPAIIVCVQVLFLPESPRWYMLRNRHRSAFESIRRLRYDDIQTSRDLFTMHCLLEAEKDVIHTRNRYLEIFTIPRNRRAMQASTIVMFMQQFCGVNVIVYYVATIFTEAGFSNQSALLASFGFGAINFTFALPAILTIDNFGRRNLVLTCLPPMAASLLLTGFGFFIPEDNKAHIAVIALGIYIFGILYSPSMGPVPFSYSAEAYPLSVRTIGMSLATATTWLFNFILAFTFPRLLSAFKPQGAFGYYAAWNIIGFFLTLFFVPETKALSLEELDQVFSVPTMTHARYQGRAFTRNMRRWILRQKLPPMEPLYQFDESMAKSYAPTAGGH
ncbi:hypothetical protein E5Q_02513 [Mixia osmundae IAM 14324]|uniref:Major facilitator superfamily (MFS) profile domain-containing protein n=1 Tax=Mixia osmundae (strain CBS 9802 / IAM 14324 / JCM 22182 / KY 12970) TaxID=764103 RepID=G7DZ46_MIXOS|nr:hypothetical protein E5Q_02513 [Mixia osmundae IAM 14324]